MSLRKWIAVLCVLVVLISAVAVSFALPDAYVAHRADPGSRVIIVPDTGLLQGTDSPQCPGGGGGIGCI